MAPFPDLVGRGCSQRVPPLAAVFWLSGGWGVLGFGKGAGMGRGHRSL